MYNQEGDEDIWKTQSRYSKTDYAFNVDELVSSEDENHYLTEAELKKDNACKGVKQISDLAERIKDRIPKATRNNTYWAVGVWQ